jgi:hypothetical protein
MSGSTAWFRTEQLSFSYLDSGSALAPEGGVFLRDPTPYLRIHIPPRRIGRARIFRNSVIKTQRAAFKPTMDAEHRA